VERQARTHTAKEEDAHTNHSGLHTLFFQVQRQWRDMDDTASSSAAAPRWFLNAFQAMSRGFTVSFGCFLRYSVSSRADEYFAPSSQLPLPQFFNHAVYPPRLLSYGTWPTA